MLPEVSGTCDLCHLQHLTTTSRSESPNLAGMHKLSQGYALSPHFRPVAKIALHKALFTDI
jgi:hypothetical protein